MPAPAPMKGETCFGICFPGNFLISYLSDKISFLAVTFKSFLRITDTVRLFMTDKDYNECVRLYADNVYRFIVKNLRHEEDARDVVQTAFEKLWRNKEEVDPAKSKSYLFTVAYNQMIDHIRKVKRVYLKEEFKEEAKVYDKYIDNARAVLNQALARLSETQRSLVMLKDYEGYSYEEIGKIMNLSESQVKVYLHRARLQLKEYIVKVENVI
jgi:RNA polymerase sigma factor (sigma-70 family)